MDTTEDAIEVWVPVEPDRDGYPQSQKWEQLWSRRSASGIRIDNIPFFAKGIACGDVVAASKTEDGWFRFERVVAPSGNSTFRIWLSEETARRAAEVLENLRVLGCRAEITLDQLIAVDVKPSLEGQVWQFLQDGLQKGMWDIQVGCSPE